jgi:hypothetical protein
VYYFAKHTTNCDIFVAHPFTYNSQVPFICSFTHLIAKQLYNNSSKYSPIFCQLNFSCLCNCPFRATMSSFDQWRNISLRHETNELCNFNYLPITSCMLGPTFLTTPVLNTLNLCPSLNMTDHNCNLIKQQVKIHTLITMLTYIRQKHKRYISP